MTTWGDKDELHIIAHGIHHWHITGTTEDS